MEGFVTKVWSFKRDYLPTKRAEPVYNFLRRTIDKQDTEKQKVKYLTENFIHKFFLERRTKKIKMLSLPGVTWDFERLLRRRLALNEKFRIKVAVTGCEMDYKVFRLSASNMPGKNKLQPYFSDNLGSYVVTNTKDMVYLLNADIFDVLAKENDKGVKYDCVWLDTTHTVISVGKKLRDFNERLSEESILIFTVLKGREHVRLETDRVDYLSNIVSPFGFNLARQFEYFDTCPMLHLIYTKTKI